MKQVILVVIFGCVTSFSATAFAGIKTAPIREAAEYVVEKFSSEAADETVETLSKKIGTYAAKYGDETIIAVRKVGPKTFALLDDAGENAPAVLRLINRYGNAAVWVASKPNSLAIFVKYGDDAAAAMIKHPGIAEPMLNEFGAPAAKALSTISSQEARRLAMMQNDKTLIALGKTDQLLEVVGRYGDAATDWMWRNKGALVSAAVVTAFVSNPEPFINGTVEVVGKGSDAIARPVAERISSSINWNLLAIILILIGGALLIIRFGWRHWLYGSPRKNMSA